MKAFQLSEKAKNLVWGYYRPDDFTNDYRQVDNTEIGSFIRFCLLEGTPYLFRDKPFLFEVIKDWLSNKINIHPKQIVLIGSGKTGFSLSPPPEYGRLFNANSDLDFTFISDSLFNSLMLEFESWAKDYEMNIVYPKNDKQNTYWKENLIRVPNQLKRGFIDTNKVPNIKSKYPVNQNINDQLYHLNIMLKNTNVHYETRRISVRVYKTWQAFTKQLSLNLCETMVKITEST